MIYFIYFQWNSRGHVRPFSHRSDTGKTIINLHIKKQKVSFIKENICIYCATVLFQECDGVRVLSRGFHDLIHRVEEPVQEIYKIGSMSPGSILLMASQVDTA
jgi:hypothetical protein